MMNEAEILLANALPEGVIVYDEHLKVYWCNKLASSLCEFQTPVIGKDICILLPYRQFVVFMRAQEVNQLQLLASDGLKRTLFITRTPYRDNLFLLIIKDVTHTYKLQAMRQDFIANVSHELRTPLTVFHGYLTILQDQQQVPAAKLQEILTHMAGQVHRMERLVEDLLLLSRLECHEPDREQHYEIVVASMLRDILADAKSLSAEQHQFVLDIDEGLLLAGQADELRSAFSNLVFNAVRYTPPKGIISIKWFRAGSHKIFQVEDNGIGIPEKHVSRITQRFYQVDKSRTYRGIGGTGLGLAIVKHVLIRHGAELDIKSATGQGSVFSCMFGL